MAEENISHGFTLKNIDETRNKMNWWVESTKRFAGIKKYKSIIKKKKKKHDNIVSLGKSNLNNIKVLIFKALVDAVISHDEFIWINNVQKEYNDMKEEIKFKDCNSSSKILVYL